MKIKSIIACGLLLLGVGAATTSCEDMLTAENNLVTTDLAPQDTVYQMMGILQRMQKLADRTILLGEVRADLVEVDPIHASSDIQELANNTISTTNKYNSPVEYYSVINSCNIYLAYVDSLYKIYGDYYYEKEICATKCFRAWCYLELAKIYGEIPFVTEPVLTPQAAEEIVASSSKANLQQVLDFAISDLAKYPYMPENNGLRPSYGTQKWNGITWNNFFIPVRALLGELYLWRGIAKGPGAGKEDFVNAIRMYHDYFCYPNEEIVTNYHNVCWMEKDNVDSWVDSYSGNEFDVSASNAGVLPLDSVAYYGNVSDLRAIFNSQYSNNYYPAVSPSQRIKDISKAQIYCYYDFVFEGDTTYASRDVNDYSNSIWMGDLRLASVYKTVSNISEARYNANVNDLKSNIRKWTDGSASILSTDVRQSYIPYYRNNILYLHLAEALNLAGFPETAFAVLAYGLTYKTLNDRSIISQDEFDRLCEIKSYGFTLSEPKYNSSAALLSKTSNSFVIWPSDVFVEIDHSSGKTTTGRWPLSTKTTVSGSTTVTSTVAPQIGIHSIGSGDTEFNKYYYLKTDSSGIVDVPEKPTAPTIVPEPFELLLDFETWCAATGNDPNKSVSQTRYAKYQTAHNDSVNAYTEWQATYPADWAQYEQDLAAYNTAVQTNLAWLASDGVRTKRQAYVRQLILEEEALEGMFEGNRFYDLMRYQMYDGKISGASSTITLPAYITEKYGATSTMEGKPWYLPLPTR